MEYLLHDLRQNNQTKVTDLVRPISIRSDLKALWHIFRTLHQQKPDIIHTHTAKAGFIGRIAAIAYGATAGKPCQIFHTYHGNVLTGYFTPLWTKVFLTIEQVLARFTEKLIVISAQQRDELALEYRVADISKFTIIPLGFNFPQLSQPEQKSRIPNFLFVGRLTKIKNPLFLLRTCVPILKENPDWTLTIVGEGELKSEMEDYLRPLPCRDQVTFVGWTENPFPYYHRAWVTLLTSVNEGTPVAVIESLVCGTPVVATDAGSVRLLANGNIYANIPHPMNLEHYSYGIVVPQNDPAAFHRALGDMVARIRAKKLKPSIGWATETFKHDRLVDDIKHLYD